MNQSYCEQIIIRVILLPVEHSFIMKSASQLMLEILYN